MSNIMYELKKMDTGKDGEVENDYIKPSIIVNGYAYPSIDPEVYEAWLPDLTFVSTFSYGMTPEGELIQLDDENLIEGAIPYEVAALMVLTPMNAEGQFSNQLVSTVLNNPKARKNLIKNILVNIKAKGLFGVDFDFEYVKEPDRDLYTELVKEATKILNAEGYLVTVALAPKTSKDQKGLLYQGHDYSGMGQVANFVLVMTYEWGYTYGPAMAVAPIDKVRNVLDYAVSEIPRDKILMGIPNYGYDWKLPFVKGESKAEKLSITQAFERANKYEVEISFDNTAQSPYYNYIDEEGIPHEVWFEDMRSLAVKLSLIGEYGLAGASYWNIMSYFPGNSEVLHSMYEVAKVV